MPHGEADLERAFRDAIAENGIDLPAPFVTALSRGLVKAVEFASDHATQNIVGMHRRKLAIQTALVTAVCVAALSIPITYVITNENAVEAQRQSHVNCRDITSLAAIEAANARKANVNAERFERESKDRFGLSPKSYSELVQAAKSEREGRLHAIQRIASSTCAPP